MSYLEDVRNYLERHYAEVAVVEKAPSRLARGEGTERNFYILKIDLVDSTKLLANRRRSTYLKLAHCFLSTVDKIVCDHGADGQQTEYAGDSIVAYFPDTVLAQRVLAAACYCRAAVSEIGKLDATLGGLELRCKLVLHFARLVVSKIGPRGDSFLTAIGHPVHLVAKMEKSVGPGGGRATQAFYDRLASESRESRRFLSAVDAEEVPGLLSSVQPAYESRGLPSAPNTADSRAGLFYPTMNKLEAWPLGGGLLTAALASRTVLGEAVARRPKVYSISWWSLCRSLGVPLHGA